MMGSVMFIPEAMPWTAAAVIRWARCSEAENNQ
jgi:hypothetical protein